MCTKYGHPLDVVQLQERERPCPRLMHYGMQILSAPGKTSNRRNEDEKGRGKSQLHSRCFQRSMCHQRDHFAEGREPLILSLAAMITNVDLGNDDGQAE